MLGFLIESFLLGLKNLRLHKLRTLLTALGIIFGVAAVIIMVAIGNGAKLEAERQMEQLGATNILVRSIPPPQSTEASGRTQRVLDYGLKRTDLTRLRTLPGLASVVPLRDTEQRVTRGDTRIPSANGIGTTPDIFRVINLRLARGRFLTQVDFDSEAPVCVIGAGAAGRIFPVQDPIGERLQVGGAGLGSAMLSIVGVLEPIGLRVGSEGASMMARNLDEDIYFPLTLARSTFGDAVTRREAGSFERKQIELSEIWLQAERREDVERLASIVENALGTAHGSVRAMAGALPGLQVDAARMRANIDRLRAELPRDAADEWFDPALAVSAGQTALAQVKALQAQLSSDKELSQ